jgi:hypothetical protein
MESNYPDEFLCPITGTLMKEPATIECGHTFEKTAIKQWLQNNLTCPSCRVQIKQMPVTNWSLKSMINNIGKKTDSKLIEIEDTASSMPVTELGIDSDSLSHLKLSCNIQDKIYLRLDVPKCEMRRPVTFVCVIDVSGSMESPIGKAEGNKIFTRLDIVKHVLNVLIAVLHENDNICLITFSDTAHVVLELSRMTKQNKRLAKNHVNGLKTICNTYTGPALKAAYAEIQKAPKHHVKSVILLTDGHDTAGDDMVLHMFDRIQKPEQIQLNTFGFSNDIKSNCLERLAKQGGGIFGFIPDQSMIGTIFINFLANTFLTYSQDVFLELNENFSFELDSQQPKKTSLQYGQRRYFSIYKKIPSYEGLPTLKVGLSKSNMIELKVDTELRISDVELEQQTSRYEVLKFLSDNRLPKLDIDLYDGLKKIKIHDFLREFQQIGEYDQNNEQLKLSLKYWDSWGLHYLKSFAFAHWFEQCLNFKAPSMKIYTYKDFDSLVDEFTDIFCTLPAPEATGDISTSQSFVPNFSVSNIMNVNGGCIFENCKIKMNLGCKSIRKVRKNDVVDGGAKVLCVLKTRFNGPLVRIGKLVITPYHPILFNDKWIFPKDLIEKRCKDVAIMSRENLIVYNLVLDTSHIINVEGIPCITLGHGFNDSVLKHSYYGTDKVIKDISNFKGWNEGFISIKRFEVKRDENNLVYNTIVSEYGN